MEYYSLSSSIQCIFLKLNLERGQNEHFMLCPVTFQRQETSVLKHDKYNILADSYMPEKSTWILKIQKP